VPLQLRPLWGTIPAFVLLVIGAVVFNEVASPLTVMMNLRYFSGHDVLVTLLLGAILIGGPIALQRLAHGWWEKAPELSPRQHAKRLGRASKHVMTAASLTVMLSLAAITLGALRSASRAGATLVWTLLAAGVLLGCAAVVLGTESKR